MNSDRGAAEVEPHQECTRRWPSLREHDFRSPVPIIGPLIRLIRQALYWLTAKWGVWAVIQQQNQINRMIEDWLREQSALLVDLDRDLALLARTVAEIEVRQRYLMRMLGSQQESDPSAPEERG